MNAANRKPSLGDSSIASTKPNANSARLSRLHSNTTVQLADLPPVHEARLQAKQLIELLQDIQDHATHILLRTHASPPASAQLISSVIESVRNHQMSRTQIRYRWQGCDWIDTIEPQKSGYRLVRIQHRS